MIEKINVHFKDYFEKSDPAAKSKLEVVLDHYNTISQFQKATNEATKELTSFKEYVYGNPDSKTEGIKKEVENFLVSNSSSLQELNDKWTDTYSTLSQKIEGLLPGATSTGLSKAYQDQNKKYRIPIWI